MSRRTFDQELDYLQGEVLALGSLVEEALVRSVETLKQRDFGASWRIVAADRDINARRYAIEESAMRLIATQQPMARDMRLLAAVLEIVSELERMGDYAKGIARINLMIGEQPLIQPLVALPIMAAKARDMLHAALVAFVERDVPAARAIPRGDDQVDTLYNQVYHDLIACILEDPGVAEQANHLMWAAHNLERAADRVLNLCERVIYAVTGELTELSTGDGDLESLG